MNKQQIPIYFGRFYRSVIFRLWFYLLALLITVIPTLSLATPVTEAAWQRWFVYDSNSHVQVYERPWQRFLDLYVTTNALGVNMVKYSRVASADQYTVTAYLAELEQIPVSNLSRPQQLAFWINLYNALIVATILHNYPVKSITEIGSGSSLNPGPWDAELITVEGVPISLNDIENRILLPIWSDPRIRYVLCCGAISCPNLPRMAITGYDVNALLDRAASNYINSSRAVRIENGKLSVSDMYLWYKQDFGGTDQAVINHLMQYANPILRAKLSQFHHIDHGFFDWGLNGL